jgi:hypothetical protein
MTSSFDITALHDGRARPRDEAPLTIATIVPDDREHFRRIMAEIIASCPASRPDHC